MGSERFPGKMAADLGGYPIIDWVLQRVRISKTLHKIILATSTNPENDFLASRAEEYEIEVFRGTETDVLSRFVTVAELYNASIIARICADNPFICSTEIDRIVNTFLEKRPDYAFNHIPHMGNNYVNGLGAEVLSRYILNTIANQTQLSSHREHVTS